MTVENPSRVHALLKDRDNTPVERQLVETLLPADFNQHGRVRARAAGKAPAIYPSDRAACIGEGVQAESTTAENRHEAPAEDQSRNGRACGYLGRNRSALVAWGKLGSTARLLREAGCALNGLRGSR